MTSYDGRTITYDEIGNPLSYYNGESYTFTWNGKRLSTAAKGSTNMSFTYNEDGIRTSKTVNGVTHTYILNGSQIVSEEWDDKLLVYLYDASGSPIGMMYRTTSYSPNQWNIFYFEKNLQGDVIALYNSSGTRVAYYTYEDAWGNHVVGYTNLHLNEGAQYNPFRYRGYYYDTDLGMYYLQSRYYDSKICRFISPDDLSYLGVNGELTSYNLYAYCGNNPVTRIDEDGESWSVVIGAVVGAIIGGVLGGLTANENNQNILIGVITGATLGATTGAIIGTGNAGMISGGLSSVVGKGVTDMIGATVYGTNAGNWEDYTVAFICGGLTGNLGKTSYGKMIVDVAVRPALSQLAQSGTRGKSFNAEKYKYDFLTRSLPTIVGATAGASGVLSENIGLLKLSVNFGICFYRATTRALYPYFESYYK